jgi:hypothetical protein
MPATNICPVSSFFRRNYAEELTRHWLEGQNRIIQKAGGFDMQSIEVVCVNPKISQVTDME